MVGKKKEKKKEDRPELHPVTSFSPPEFLAVIIKPPRAFGLAQDGSVLASTLKHASVISPMGGGGGGGWGEVEVGGEGVFVSQVEMLTVLS